MKNYLIIGQMVVLALILLLGIIGFKEAGFIKGKQYTAEDFEIETIKSKMDKDNDGIDDYTDILEGAKEFVAMNPKYKSSYYKDGYPDDGYYVCTDVIWYALSNAGYNLKELVDNDIKEHQEDYNITIPDPNIDFRRVRNLKVYFDKYATNLTLDYNNIQEFQPGDIVIFSNSHIAIVSEIRNKKGINYIIHHDGVHKYIDDGLTRNTIVGHYRFNLLSEN